MFSSYNINISDVDMRESLTVISDADFYKKFMKLFSLVVQMRNSNSKTGEDKLVSPVKNEHGYFFETGIYDGLPMDADANGAYNIARKGLWIVEQIQKTDLEHIDKIKFAISNKEWLKYAQENTL